ncbi:MAG: tetratricopeptide repeat protein [Verrucomicrobia bacterium]|nr:tetratricopeptide repeat protein [Verrucomicrobiota bacterium]
MSRFSSLEFNDDFESDFESQQVTKDELFYSNEARAAFEETQFEKSLRYYAKVLEFNPNNVAAWAGQVKALIELGEFPEAKLWAEKALEKFPDDSELLAAKAVALGRMGDLKAALAFSDASIEERGGTPYIWLARGDVLLARKEKRADYCFEKAFMLASGDWVVRWCASRIRSFYEHFSIALKFAQDALNLNPGSSAAWLQAGHCQLALGLSGLAENSFTQAKQLNPDCREARLALDSLSHNGWFSRMRSSLRQFFHRS